MHLQHKSPSTDLPSLVKQKWQKNKFFRYSLNFIATVGSTESLAIVAFLSPQRASILPTIVFAFIPAMFLWWAITVFQHYYDKAETYSRSNAKYKEEMDSLIQLNQMLRNEIMGQATIFTNLIQNTADKLEFYTPFRKLLDKEPGQQKLIGHFTKKSVREALCIWNISRKDFLDLAQEGIRDCKKCQLIHHGSLEKIQPHPYLNEIQEKQSIRIVILPEKYKDEVMDDEKKTEFLKKIGKTPSYAISEERFFEIAELTDIKERIKLDDCAIFDEQLLLLWQHDRRFATLCFRGENVFEGILKAFQELEQQLKGYPHPDVDYQFQPINGQTNKK